jgi:hypothetical protein
MKDAMYLPSRREMFPLVLAGAISGKAEVPAPRRIVLKASDGVDVYACTMPRRIKHGRQFCCFTRPDRTTPNTKPSLRG